MSELLASNKPDEFADAVPADERKTIPFLNKFEKTKLIGVRMQQIGAGAIPMVPNRRQVDHSVGAVGRQAGDRGGAEPLVDLLLAKRILFGRGSLRTHNISSMNNMWNQLLR